jgi:hypothetical protein
LRGALATKQSGLSFVPWIALRHRAALRAARWLAMTAERRFDFDEFIAGKGEARKMVRSS